MKKKILPLLPYIIILAINFYALPLLIKDTGRAMLMMLCIIPLITFICSIVYGIKQGFNLLITVLTILLFIPAIFIFYNSSAWIYVIAYAIISLIGNATGRIFYKA